MKKQCIVFVLITVLSLSIFLTACNQQKNDSGTDRSSSETTVVLETTAQGGTVEQDSEGNIITKDNSGAVVSIKDQEGKTIPFEEYAAAHSWIHSDNSSSGSGTGNSGNAGQDSANAHDEQVEESIPVVIATVPDEEDLIELPD